jgi:hypothetical protein
MAHEDVTQSPGAGGFMMVYGNAHMHLYRKKRKKKKKQEYSEAFAQLLLLEQLWKALLVGVFSWRPGDFPSSSVHMVTIVACKTVAMSPCHTEVIRAVILASSQQQSCNGTGAHHHCTRVPFLSLSLSLSLGFSEHSRG